MKVFTMRFFSIGLTAMIASAAICASAIAAPKEITWEDLAPLNVSGKTLDFRKLGKPKGMPSLSEFDGSTEDLDAYVEFMDDMKQSQPDGNVIAVKFNGKEVKIAGYVTPISFDGDDVVEFLFVPYQGACIHVPPPPANQIVYVSKAKGLTAESLYDPVWLTGTLNANAINTIVANAGYSIESGTVEPYTE